MRCDERGKRTADSGSEGKPVRNAVESQGKHEKTQGTSQKAKETVGYITDSRALESANPCLLNGVTGVSLSLR